MTKQLTRERLIQAALTLFKGKRICGGVHERHCTKSRRQSPYPL